MLDDLRNEARRQQLPYVQIAQFVGLTGFARLEINNPNDLFTGYAKEPDALQKTGMPAHLDRALSVATKLKALGDEAFITLRSLKDEG